MYPSRFFNGDNYVFVEIFSIRVPGVSGPVSVQRRFAVTPKWQGDMESMPVMPDRDHCGTPFVLAEVAVLLINAGVLEIPDGASWCVQYAGSGHYFDSHLQALEFVSKRWPKELAMFADDLNQGAPLELSPSRKAMFDANVGALKPWLEKSDEIRKQVVPKMTTSR